MTHKSLIPACSLLLLLSACGGDDGGSLYGNTTTAGTAGTLTAGNDSTTDDPSGDGDPSTGGDGDGDATTTGGIKLDLGDNSETGMNTGGDAGDGNGCKKVDFLFIIDNSGSMLEEQNNLKASFPSFINSISSTLDEAQDYHIMVIDSDAWVYAGCGVLCGFPLPGLCQGFSCDTDPNTAGNQPTQPFQCESVLGAGVTYPRGSDASNVDCNIAGGKRYMDSNQPNLVGTFQCAASVGTGSTDDPERGMEAMVAAVAEPGPGQPAANCNSGFLRDDAILVVTFITDEDDDAGDGSAGTVDTWRQALIDAKNGDESAIVVLGLFGDDDLPGAICNGAAESSARLRAFLDSWGSNGFFGSICADDYDGFFQEAVSIIDTTCDEFEPPK